MSTNKFIARPSSFIVDSVDPNYPIKITGKYILFFCPITFDINNKHNYIDSYSVTTNFTTDAAYERISLECSRSKKDNDYEVGDVYEIKDGTVNSVSYTIYGNEEATTYSINKSFSGSRNYYFDYVYFFDFSTAIINGVSINPVYGDKPVPTITISLISGFVMPSKQFVEDVVVGNIVGIHDQYTMQSGTFHYKRDDASGYTNISFTGTSCTVPANTFVTGHNYDAYVTGVMDDGTAVDSAHATLNTVDATGSVTAVSPKNEVVYGSAVMKWSYSNGYGSDQYAYDLQTSTDQITWTDVVTKSITSNTTYSIGSITTSGQMYWRVRGYNQDDVATEWSSVAGFVNNIPPKVPTITSVSGAGRITVKWTHNDQIAYRVQIVINENVVHDSDWIYSSSKTYFANQYLPNGNYTIKVAVMNTYGKYSEWATIERSQNINITAPTASIVRGLECNEITASGSFQTFYIIRNGIVVGKTTSDAVYRDFYCNGTDIYTIRGVNGNDEFADTVITAKFECRIPCVITTEGKTINLSKNLGSKASYQYALTHDISDIDYIGASKQKFITGAMKKKSFSVSCSEPVETGVDYFYRTINGFKAWVICSSISAKLSDTGIDSYSFTLNETDHDEGIEYDI